MILTHRIQIAPYTVDVNIIRNTPAGVAASAYVYADLPDGYEILPGVKETLYNGYCAACLTWTILCKALDPYLPETGPARDTLAWENFDGNDACECENDDDEDDEHP
ncbi:MAG: hypothetical protein ACTH32_06610 [Microbacterium gubbeenense]|uniref:hypothetical protein n=1 Tax=Microbacterium gubbeenense TaxID=159896 RepID=UPI003F963131